MHFLAKASKLFNPSATPGQSADGAPKVSLKYHLHKHITGYEKARINKRVHASELMKDDMDFCPRAKCLMDVSLKEMPSKYVTTSMRLTWDLGLTMSDLVIKHMANAGVMMGNWRCLRCDKFYAMCKRPAHCYECGTKYKKARFRYSEVLFKSKYSDVGGSVDALVNLGQSKLIIVEIKSILKEGFKELTAPKAEAKWRTNLYMRLAEESESLPSKLVDTSRALVLYTSKTGYGGIDNEVQEWAKAGALKGEKFSPFKEYWVKRDDSATDYLVEEARKVKLFRDGDAPIPEGICTSQLCDRAAKCPVAAECFGPKFIAGKFFKKGGVLMDGG